MNASELRQRVTFQRKISEVDEYGGTDDRWEDHLTVWGQFIPLSVSQKLIAKAEQSAITARLVIRYTQNIDGTMRVIYKGRAYEIDGEPLADNKSGSEYLTLILRS